MILDSSLAAALHHPGPSGHRGDCRLFRNGLVLVEKRVLSARRGQAFMRGRSKQLASGIEASSSMPAAILGGGKMTRMYGPAVRRKRGFVNLLALRSCINVSGLRLERVLRATMDISADASSLAASLKWAM
jgi:hypothetical protein